MSAQQKISWARKGARTKPVVRDLGRIIEIDHHGVTLRTSRRAFENLIHALQVGRFNQTRMGFRVVAEWLRSLIESGEIPYGGELPTEQQVMDLWHCARGTVRRAYEVLENEGLAIALHGRNRVVRYPEDHPVPRQFRIEPGPNRVARIARRLRELIVSGHFQYNTALPGMPALARLFVADED